MKNLASAILVAMQTIGYLQKDKTVGSGNSSYKGLSDQKATQGIREALMGAGIIALPTVVEPTANCKVSHFEAVDSYGKSTMKLAVFTEVRITYTLIHAESGESATIQAIGQGVDNGDKAAGKAMTYAKKNALLNALLISSGLDADDIHSDDLPTLPPPKKLADVVADAIKYVYSVLPNSNRDYRTEIGQATTEDEVRKICREAKAEALLLNNAPA